MNTFIIDHFNLFILLIFCLIGVSILSITLLAKFFKASNRKVGNAFSVLLLTIITFFFFYECFESIFSFFGSKNNIIVYILSILISFLTFDYVFQSKFSFYGRTIDVLKIFVWFVLFDIMFTYFFFSISRYLNLI